MVGKSFQNCIDVYTDAAMFGFDPDVMVMSCMTNCIRGTPFEGRFMDQTVLGKYFLKCIDDGVDQNFISALFDFSHKIDVIRYFALIYYLYCSELLIVDGIGSGYALIFDWPVKDDVDYLSVTCKIPGKRGAECVPLTCFYGEYYSAIARLDGDLVIISDTELNAYCEQYLDNTLDEKIVCAIDLMISGFIDCWDRLLKADYDIQYMRLFLLTPTSRNDVDRFSRHLNDLYDNSYSSHTYLTPAISVFHDAFTDFSIYDTFCCRTLPVVAHNPSLSSFHMLNIRDIAPVLGCYVADNVVRYSDPQCRAIDVIDGFEHFLDSLGGSKNAAIVAAQAAFCEYVDNDYFTVISASDFISDVYHLCATVFGGHERAYSFPHPYAFRNRDEWVCDGILDKRYVASRYVERLLYELLFIYHYLDSVFKLFPVEVFYRIIRGVVEHFGEYRFQFLSPSKVDLSIYVSVRELIGEVPSYGPPPMTHRRFYCLDYKQYEGAGNMDFTNRGINNGRNNGFSALHNRATFPMFNGAFNAPMLGIPNRHIQHGLDIARRVVGQVVEIQHDDT